MFRGQQGHAEEQLVVTYLTSVPSAEGAPQHAETAVTLAEDTFGGLLRATPGGSFSPWMSSDVKTKNESLFRPSLRFCYLAGFFFCCCLKWL